MPRPKQIDSSWRKIQAKLEGEDEYENLDKADRVEVFGDHIRCLCFSSQCYFHIGSF